MRPVHVDIIYGFEISLVATTNAHAANAVYIALAFDACAKYILGG